MQRVDQLIGSSCNRNQDRTALRHKDAGRWVETSYRQLWELSTQAAGGLTTKLFKPGDHAALIASASPRWLAAYLGIMRRGGVAVPIDKELKAAELRHVLSDSEAKVLFTEQAYLETILEILGDLPRLEKLILLDADPTALRKDEAVNNLVAAWEDLIERKQIAEADVANLESLARTALRPLTANRSDPNSNNGQIDFFAPQRANLAKLVKSGRLVFFADLAGTAEIPESPRTAKETAVILYTSGTTGQSKGAMLSHTNLTTNIAAAVKHFGLDSSMSTLSFLPINHVFEQVCGVLLPLSLGGTISFAESLKKLGENLNEVKPSFLLGVPAVYRLVLDRIYKKINSKPLTKMLFNYSLTRSMVAAKVRKSVGENTTFVSGGAALDPEVARGYQELGLRLLQGYGITETSPVIAAESPTLQHIGTVGKMFEDVQVKIDKPNAEGVGEILVKGPNVMQGYYKRPEATAEVLIDGWYHTGDLGRLDENNHLSICGRLKNLIVTPNGKNVYPEEVENELLKSPFIAEVMVYGHKVDSTTEEVYAVIFPDQENLDSYGRESKTGILSSTAVENLIRQQVLDAGKQLADYKRVKKFTLREDEFPKTTTRKIKRYVVEPEITTG